MNIWSVIWAISLALFLGGLGFPIPENPILIGGGYAIYRHEAHPIASLCMWYLAILCGDFFLFAIVHWFFGRPTLSNFMRRWAGKVRLERYQRTFVNWGGWTLFLSRFTFGVRAAAYVAAGAADYPWMRFLTVDGLSVGIQVLIFVGIGYYAGDSIEWAKATSGRIALLLVMVAFITIVLTCICSSIVRRISNRMIE